MGNVGWDIESYASDLLAVYKPPPAVSSLLFADIWDDMDGAHIVWELCAEAWDRGWTLSVL